jgi:hypothetical protein
MDSYEGDIGIPSFTKPSPPLNTPPQRSSTLPSSTTTTTTSDNNTISSKDLTRRLSFPDARLQDETLSNLHRWIIGFVLVDFDIDTGPVRSPSS